MKLQTDAPFTLSEMKLEPLLKYVRERATGLSSRLHGESHWLRVTKVGLELAKHVSDCDLTVIFLFGVLHDTQRLHDGHDPEHGERAAYFAQQINNRLFLLSDDQLQVLMHACRYHEKGQVSDQPTIGLCWDADRLNLWRVNTIPMSQFLSSSPAKTWVMRLKALPIQFQKFTWSDLYQQYSALGNSRT